MEYSVEVQRSRRRTISLAVERDLRVVAKVPQWMSGAAVDAFLEKHRAWIQKHVALQRERNERTREFSPDEAAALARRAREIADAGVAQYAAVMGVSPAGVKITSAVTRWGSCSGKNSICFSYRIALLPPDAVDYIIVHELAHIRQKNHGPRFYAEVAKVLPDYKRRIDLIKQTQRQLGL